MTIPIDIEEADGVYICNVTTCAGNIAAACAAEALGADLSSAARVICVCCSGGDGSCPTYMKSYLGSKVNHLDACGHALSSPLHCANRP
eukprot:jgi/Tetstr1/460613/TSEL_000538.t1